MSSIENIQLLGMFISLTRKALAVLGFLCFSFGCVKPADAATKPNVIVILADDLGWPDLGIQGARDLQTPNIDSLATNGVRFLNGYVTSPVCSPSRAGLMSGRYQQRFGHEINPGPALETNSIFGLPLTQSTMGNRMKGLGYTTGWIGKSHLGGAPEYWPLQRGFDEFFGFLEGHHDYTYPYVITPDDPIRRGSAVVLETNYLTTAFSRECVSFIDRHANEPFFLYAPFNAVHFPMQATADLFAGLDTNLYGGYTARYTNAAMLKGLDLAVGDILTKLRQLQLETNTLIFFTSDNGAPGPSGVDANGSVNTPLRGYKGSLYEGGIRVPFIVQWRGHFQPRVETNALVSTLDILPTSVAAGAGSIQPAWRLDGVNLLPILTNSAAAPPTHELFWRLETEGGDGVPPGPRAMRRDNWKLVKPSNAANWELYDLGADIREITNLADTRPDVVQSMVYAYDAWNMANIKPLWDFNTRFYTAPEFVREDLRLGDVTVSYLAPDFAPGAGMVAFQDANRQLWEGAVDLNAGFFFSGSGKDNLVDLLLPQPEQSPYGPVWESSTSGLGLFYTKSGDGGNLQLWKAHINFPIGNFVVEALTHSMTNESFGPRPSQNSAGSQKLLFSVAAGKLRETTAWSEANSADNFTPLTRPSPPTQNGKWLPDSDDFVYTGLPQPNAPFAQLIRIETATGTARLLTTGPGTKSDAIGFLAPELGGELLCATIVNHTNISFYRDMHDNPNGYLSNFLSVAFPPGAAAPYIYSLETVPGGRGFNGVSYFCFASYQNNDPANPGDSAIWLLSLGPDADHHLIRRLDSDPTDTTAPAVAGRRDPKLVIGGRELFVFYSVINGTNPVQLRRARTGVTLPEFTEGSTGFSDLRYTRSFTGGSTDPTGRPMNNTETTALVPFNGWLFAGQGSRGALPYPTNLAALTPEWSGAQILVKTSAVAPWRVDYTAGIDPFPLHVRVEALQNVRLTTDHAGKTMGQRDFLLASMRDVGTPGAEAASVRVRNASGVWVHSHVTTATTEAYPVSFAAHKDGTVHHIFTGLSNGQIHRGVYNSALENFVWEESPEFSGGGAVTGLAEANGEIYAASGLVQPVPGGAVSGGLYRRIDANAGWQLVYRWPYPLDLSSRSPETGQMLGLTAVPEPHGEGRLVLLAARAWPGVIERIDPQNDHAVTVELDVRDFYARLWQDERVRSEALVIAYTGFTLTTNPVTGELVHLVGLRIDDPEDFTGSLGVAHFLIRHLDGTYENADVPNDLSPSQLRATRCAAVSPFPEDAGAVFYFGGYDTRDEEAHKTAWIIRGDWSGWPAISLTKPNPPDWELTWPILDTHWLLERSPLLGPLATWQTVSEQPTRAALTESLSISPGDVASYYRLRRP